MKRDVGWNIYLPPQYETSGLRYPVIYWLHGSGGDESPDCGLRGARQAIAAGLVHRPSWSFRMEARRPNIATGRIRMSYRNDDRSRVDSYVDENFRTSRRSLPAPWRNVDGSEWRPQARAKVSGDVRLGRRLRRSYKRLPLDGYFRASPRSSRPG